MKREKASRAELLIWLYYALPWVPHNLFSITEGKMPPQWVKDAKKEVKSSAKEIAAFIKSPAGKKYLKKKDKS